jgi:hypothetical protein
MRQIEWALAAIGSLLGAACGITRLDAGSNRADAGAADPDQGHVYSGTQRNSFGPKCDAQAPDWLAGRWSGTFDDFSLPSGSQSIEVEVNGSYQYPGGFCGTVTFGDGPPLPLPEDAASLPPGYQIAADLRRVIREGFPYDFFVAGPISPAMDEGFVTENGSGISGRRVRFPINVAQYFNAWCNMQRAYYHATVPPKYTCVPQTETFVDVDDPTCLEFGGPTFPGLSCAQRSLLEMGLCYCTGPELAVQRS